MSPARFLFLDISIRRFVILRRHNRDLQGGIAGRSLVRPELKVFYILAPRDELGKFGEKPTFLLGVGVDLDASRELGSGVCHGSILLHERGSSSAVRDRGPPHPGAPLASIL